MASTSPLQAAVENSEQGLSKRRRRWEDLTVILVIGFLPLVINGVYQLFVPIAGTPGTINFRFCSGLFHEAGVLFLFGLLLRRQGRQLSDIGLSFHWLDLLRGAGLAAGSWICSVFFAALLGWLYFWNGSQLHYRDSEPIFRGVLPLLLLVYSMAAPLYEEVLVKGYLMTELIGLSLPIWLATLCSILLQTSYHLYYGFAGAIYLGVGFAISAIYFAKTRRLTPVIFSHLFWNLAATYLHWHR